MRLILVRYGFAELTLGRLYIDGELACFTVEPTPVPVGEYALHADAGLLAARGAGAPYLVSDQPVSRGIQLGGRVAVLLDGEFHVQDSTLAFRHVYPRVAAELAAGRPVTLHVRTKEAA